MGRRLNHALLNDRKKYCRDLVHSRIDARDSALVWQFPFGKYRGQHIADIPTQYLSSIRKYVRSLYILAHISDELERRARLIIPGN